MFLGRNRERSSSTPSALKQIPKEDNEEVVEDMLLTLDTEHTSNRRFVSTGFYNRRSSRSESSSPTRRAHMRTASVPHSSLSHQRDISNISLPFDLQDEDMSQLSDTVSSQKMNSSKYVNKMYTIRSGEEALEDRLDSESESIIESDSMASSINTQESIDRLDNNDSTSTRLTALIYKRKNGLRGKLKSSYVKASDISHDVKHSIYQYTSKMNCMMGNQQSISSGRDGAGEVNNHARIWERRRIVLDGRLLMYYHEDAGLGDETSRAPEVTQSNQAFAKFTKRILELGHYHSEINAPRGIIDLVSSNATATVLPIEHNSTSPTPYRLAIMVRSEVKWLLCFDTSDELMKWLNVLTNVALAQSAALFKKEHGYDYVALDSKGSDTKDEATDNVLTKNSPRNDKEERQQISSIPSEVAIQNSSVKQNSIFSHFQSIAENDFIILLLLLNVGFIYLFCMADSSTLLSHSIVAVFVNILTFAHLLRKRGDLKSWRQKIIGDLNNSSTKSKNSKQKQMRAQRTPSNTTEQVNSIKPNAGTTLNRVDSPDDEFNPTMNRWMAPCENIIQVRGSNYLYDGHKIPAATGLYDLVEVDAFDSDVHVVDLSSRFKIPPAKTVEKGAWKAPTSLIISFALPMASSEHAWRRKAGNSKGYIVTCYYQMKDQTRRLLEIISDESLSNEDKEAKFRDEVGNNYKSVINGVKLWERWCTKVPEDEEMQKRLKFISKGENLKELGVPSWICKYNGKPVLMKRPNVTNYVFHHPEQDAIEIDINLHPFPFIFKQAMSYLKDHYFSRMLMTFAFLIEGRDEDELPEVLLGNPIQLVYPDPAKIIVQTLT
jgi:hypothetical protein